MTNPSHVATGDSYRDGIEMPGADALTPTGPVPGADYCAEMRFENCQLLEVPVATPPFTCDIRAMIWRDCRIVRRYRMDKSLPGTAVRNFVSMERVEGGCFSLSDIPVRGEFTVRDCRFLGTPGGGGEKVFEAAADTARFTRFERVRFGTPQADIISEGCRHARKEISAALAFPDCQEAREAVRNQSMEFIDCVPEYLMADCIRTRHLRFQRCRSERYADLRNGLIAERLDALASFFKIIDLRQARIGRMEVRDCVIELLDLRQARVDQLDIADSAIARLDLSGAQIGALNLHPGSRRVATIVR